MSTSVRTAGVTVRAAVPGVAAPDEAEMVDAPALAPVAKPAWSTVAKFVALEAQLTAFVMSVWLPSENSPFALKAWVWPVAMEAVSGVRLIVCNIAAETVATADPLLDPMVAVIVEVPADDPVTRPFESTVAAEVLELHVAWLVTSCEVPSAYVPSTESCLLWPDAMENTSGVTVIEKSPGAGTETPAVPDIEFQVAVTVTLPVLSAVRLPLALTTAIVGSELCQAAWLVID